MGDAIPKSAALRDAIGNPKPTVAGTNAVLTVEEACQYLRISKWTLYRLIQRNELTTMKIGKHRRIRRESLEEFVASCETAHG